MTSEQQSAEALLHARYRANAPGEKGPWNETLAAIISHRSVRAYLDKPVPDEWLTRIIAAAQSAATSSNLQSWSVIAVRESEHKARLAHLCADQKFIVQAPLFLVWCADLSRPRRLAKGRSLDGADYLEAFLVAVIDATLAAQNAAIAAESLGLGVCYVGALRNHPEEIAAELKLPPEVFGAFGMSVGFPDPARPAAIRPRLPQTGALHFEHYDISQEDKTIAAFNAVHSAFQEEQKMRHIDWPERVVNRLATIEALDGRHLLREALYAMGFPLR